MLLQNVSFCPEQTLCRYLFGTGVSASFLSCWGTASCSSSMAQLASQLTELWCLLMARSRPLTLLFLLWEPFPGCGNLFQWSVHTFDRTFDRTFESCKLKVCCALQFVSKTAGELVHGYCPLFKETIGALPKAPAYIREAGDRNAGIGAKLGLVDKILLEPVIGHPTKVCS